MSASPTRLRVALLLCAGLAAAIGFQAWRRPSHATAVHCDENAPPSAGRVTMLTAEWCPYCTRARDWLVARGVPYCEWDIERSATGAARHARGEIKVIPQIFIADRVLVGFNPHELEQTLAAHDLLPMPGFGNGAGDAGEE
jgi:glutaredoxin